MLNEIKIRKLTQNNSKRLVKSQKNQTKHFNNTNYTEHPTNQTTFENHFTDNTRAHTLHILYFLHRIVTEDNRERPPLRNIAELCVFTTISRYGELADHLSSSLPSSCQELASEGTQKALWSPVVSQRFGCSFL